MIRTRTRKHRFITSLAACAGIGIVAPTFAGEVDYALFLDGIAGEAVSQANFDVEALTVEAWLNVETVNLEPCCTFAGVAAWGRNADASWEFGLVGEPAGGPIKYVYPFFKINWGKENSHSMLSSHVQIELSTWTHVAATYDGQTARMYVDGELVDEQVFDAPLSTGGPGAQMSIGNNFPGGDEYLGGTIDEVRIWNVARSKQQIIQTMYRPLVGTDTGLHAYYDLNEGKGTTLLDRSGNGRDATLVEPGAAAGAMWVESTSPVDLMIGDVNADDAVDVTDLLALLSAWGACSECATDLNGDGAVDVTDLLVLLGNWDAPTPPTN